MLTGYSFIKFFFIFIIASFATFYNGQTYTLPQLDSINAEYWNKGELEAAANFNFKALHNYEKQNNHEGVIATYINISNAFSYLNKNKEGLEYLDMARKKMKKVRHNPLLLAKLYGQYGNCYALLGLYHQSNKNFNKAILYSKKIRDEEQKKKKLYTANAWKSYNFNKLGLTDSAKAIDYRNLKLFPDNPSVYEKIAHLYISKRNHLDSAEYYLDKALPLIDGSIYNKTEILISFGDLYIAKKDYKKALEYFLESLELSKKMKNKYSEEIINLRLSKAYKSMGDKENSNEYFNNYSVLNHEIQSKDKRVVSLMVEKFIKEKEDEEKSKKQKLYLLFAVLTILFMVFIYFIHRKYLRRQKKKDELLQEKSLEAKHLKDQVNNAFEKVIQLAKDSDPFFLIRFKEVYSEFYEKLISQYPILTEHDMKFCAYLRLNLTNKEIIQYENISLRTVESKKYRLKKKLGLGTEINLNKWILEL